MRRIEYRRPDAAALGAETAGNACLVFHGDFERDRRNVGCEIGAQCNAVHANECVVLDAVHVLVKPLVDREVGHIHVVTRLPCAVSWILLRKFAFVDDTGFELHDI